VVLFVDVFIFACMVFSKIARAYTFNLCSLHQHTHPKNRWIHHKARNFAPAELAATLAALAALRYRNPWLLGRLGRALLAPALTAQRDGSTSSSSSSRLSSLSGRELATVTASLAQLRWRRKELLGAIANEAAARLQQQQQQQQQQQAGVLEEEAGNSSSSDRTSGSAFGGQPWSSSAIAAAVAAASALAAGGVPVAAAAAAPLLTSADAAVVATSLAAQCFRHDAFMDELLACGGAWPINDRAAVAQACAAVGRVIDQSWLM
jgi:hypothetical protein